jgi:hypothetical protein
MATTSALQQCRLVGFNADGVEVPPTPADHQRASAAGRFWPWADHYVDPDDRSKTLCGRPFRHQLSYEAGGVARIEVVIDSEPRDDVNCGHCLRIAQARGL